MDDDIKLLNHIYKSAEAGKTSLSKVIPKIKDENFKSTLARQSYLYDQFFVSCEERLEENGEGNKNKSKSMLNNIGLDISIMFNNKSKNIADILIKENTSSIHEISRSIVEYQGASNEVKELASLLLNNERNNIEELQKFI